jgi:hypothetical protein
MVVIDHDSFSGLIQNADSELIDLVRSLVESYCGEENTIILTTIPMCGAFMFLANNLPQ